MKSKYSYVKIEFTNSKIRKNKNIGQKEVHNFQFYKKGIHLDYIARDNAVYIQNDNFDVSKLKDKKIDVVNYMNNHTKSKLHSKKSGVYSLFDLEAKDIDIGEEKKKLKKLSHEQNVWEMIINPGDLGITNYLIDKKYWAKILDKNLSKLLKANNLDKENIEGHFVIHTNTNYPHIHLSFWEKTKSFID